MENQLLACFGLTNDNEQMERYRKFEEKFRSFQEEFGAKKTLSPRQLKPAKRLMPAAEDLYAGFRKDV